MIATISILVSISIPRIQGLQNEARVIKAKSELKTLEIGILSYGIHQDPVSYPPSSDTLVDTYLKNPSPLLVSDILYDPFNIGNEYKYRLSNNGKYYVIFSYGIDGKKGINSINNNGKITGSIKDDIYRTNGDT